ncbi:hypothetical protein JR316_0011014 [Psilocybe cubensis]|uniref:Uncharacterized protein n=2 Tax=Psilocybe cubensis TaxID=181762 RepID=A0ACB8GN69_PSICU|nr:hypothetical protein JR316_0011014 [Psilocybe cubensis]KAH9477098.1 hypothetical protein JR316_0011014 [Psilocybe cubensis]
MIVNLLRLYANGTLLENDIHFPAPPNNFNPAPSVLRMNVLWFLSMTLALSVVLVGTICLQWIREFQRDPRVNSQRAFAIRQMRRDGLYKWKVPSIISSLPILLQLSLFLFFWGLFEFLWSLNSKVTLINSAVVAVVIFCVMATLFLPALQVIFASSDKIEKLCQCPYKSPLAWTFAKALFWIALKVIDCIRWSIRSDFQGKKKKLLTELCSKDCEDWDSFDNQWQHCRSHSYQPRSDIHASNESCDIGHGFAWMGQKYMHTQDTTYTLYHMIRNVHRSTSTTALKRLFDNNASSSFLDLALSVTSPQDEDLLHDLYSALLLSHVATSSKDPHQQEALIFQRTELFIRIANFGAASTTRRIQSFPGDTPREFVERCIGDKELGINPFVGNPEYLTKLPMVLMVQIIIAFRTYLTEGLELHDVLWDLSKQIVLHLLSTPDRPSFNISMEDELDFFNVNLSHHLSRIKLGSIHFSGANGQRDQHDRQRIREYVRA